MGINFRLCWKPHRRQTLANTIIAVLLFSEIFGCVCCLPPSPCLWTLPSVWVFLSPRCPVKSGSGVSWILWSTGLLSLSLFPIKKPMNTSIKPFIECVSINYGCCPLKDGDSEQAPSPTVCVVPYLAELGIWAVPVYTWDKGERQCHPAPPRDSRGRLMWPCTRFSVTAAATSRREDPTRAERLSLLAGLVPTQWSTLWFGWVFSDTDKCLCDGGKTM